MTPFIISKQSWHFRLIDKWRRLNDGSLYDNWTQRLTFCDYTKRLIIAATGLLLYYGAIAFLVIFATAAIVAGVAVIALIMWLMPQAVWAGNFSHPSVFPGMMLATWALTAVGVPALLEYHEQKRRSIPTNTQRSVIGQAYDSWKHKYCIPVQVVDHNNKQ